MMPDREKVIKEYEEFVDKYECFSSSDDYVLEMHKAVLALLKEKQEQLDELVPPKKWIVCKACGHKLRNDWLWCPWCRWEIRQGYNADELN